MIEGLEFKTLNTNYPQNHVFSNKYGDSVITVTESPFMNCQTYAIGNITEILQYEKPKIIEILQYINNQIEKNQLIIDFSIDYLTKVKTLFNANDFIFIQEYENFTGSQMVMCLINVRDVLGGNPEDDENDDDWNDDDDY